MLEEGENIFKYSPGDKSLKAPFIIYADLECLLKKEQPRQNIAENSYTEKKAKHKPSGYSLSLVCSFDETKNRRKFYRRRDYIEKLCNDLRELVTEIINYKEKETASLEDEETTIYESQKVTYTQKSFVIMKIMKKNLNCTKKSEIIATTQENLEELLIVFAI